MANGEGVRPIMPLAPIPLKQAGAVEGKRHSARGASPVTTPQPQIVPADRREQAPASAPSGGVVPQERVTLKEPESRTTASYQGPAEDPTLRSFHRKANDMRTPTVLRAGVEILETVLRAVSPLADLISAGVRALRMIARWVRGEDNSKEWVRLAGDLVGAAGFFYPPLLPLKVVGAATNALCNLRWNESQVMGGVNEVWDGEVEVRNPFRTGASAAGEWAGEWLDWADRAILGAPVEPGSEKDDGTRPLIAPEEGAA